jgi:hypothetical protein
MSSIRFDTKQPSSSLLTLATKQVWELVRHMVVVASGIGGVGRMLRARG